MCLYEAHRCKYPEYLKRGYHYIIKVTVTGPDYDTLMYTNEFEIFVGDAFNNNALGELYTLRLQDTYAVLECRQTTRIVDLLYINIDNINHCHADVVKIEKGKYTKEELVAFHNECLKMRNKKKNDKKENCTMKEQKKTPAVDVTLVKDGTVDRNHPFEHIMVYPSMKFVGYIDFTKVPDLNGKATALCVKKLPVEMSETVSKEPDECWGINNKCEYHLSINEKHDWGLEVIGENPFDEESTVGSPEFVPGKVTLNLNYEYLDQNYKYWIALCPIVENRYNGKPVGYSCFPEEAQKKIDAKMAERVNELKEAAKEYDVAKYLYRSPANDYYNIDPNKTVHKDCIRVRYDKHDGTAIGADLDAGDEYSKRIKAIQEEILNHRKETKKLMKKIERLASPFEEIFEANVFSKNYPYGKEIILDTDNWLNYTIEIINVQTGTIEYHSVFSSVEGEMKKVTIRIPSPKSISNPIVAVDNTDDKLFIIPYGLDPRYIIRITGIEIDPIRSSCNTGSLYAELMELRDRLHKLSKAEKNANNHAVHEFFRTTSSR